MADSLYAVQAEGVGYSYGRKRVLDNIDLKLEEGDVLCPRPERKRQNDPF